MPSTALLRFGLKTWDYATVLHVLVVVEGTFIIGRGASDFIVSTISGHVLADGTS